MKQRIKNLIGNGVCRPKKALDRWSGILAVADELQAQIDLTLEIIRGLGRAVEGGRGMRAKKVLDSNYSG